MCTVNDSLHPLKETYFSNQLRLLQNITTNQCAELLSEIPIDTSIKTPSVKVREHCRREMDRP